MNTDQVAKWGRTSRCEEDLPDPLFPYSTRHVYASSMIDEGVPARVVQGRIVQGRIVQGRIGYTDGRMTRTTSR